MITCHYILCWYMYVGRSFWEIYTVDHFDILYGNDYKNILIFNIANTKAKNIQMWNIITHPFLKTKSNSLFFCRLKIGVLSFIACVAYYIIIKPNYIRHYNRKKDDNKVRQRIKTRISLLVIIILLIKKESSPPPLLCSLI